MFKRLAQFISDLMTSSQLHDNDRVYAMQLLYNYDPNRPVMHLRRVEGIELIWCRFRDRFFPETEGECDD
ncbi:MULTISPECIES: hypothetical protein [Kamptonema]|uniref:hypothetical protein n=1 Tax=Kamptonema TaxID=1501433 RepID=UPI0001DAC138|nr:MULTISPECIES: hypothetical protein [Kamptonema]CBN56622.1 hypothetical protein OSCI_3090015 [Kamptonema sp. PCC 6506]